MPIPNELKDEFLNGVVDEQRQEAFTNHTDYLMKKKEDEKIASDSFMNDELTKHILDITKKIKLSMPHLDVIIKNGSYKVTKYIEKDPFDIITKQYHHATSHINNRPKSNNKDIEQEIKEEVAIQPPPKRATQKIHTVQTESIIVKIVKFIFGCIVNKGSIRKIRKEKIVMDGINLALEQGKMYLVL